MKGRIHNSIKLADYPNWARGGSSSLTLTYDFYRELPSFYADLRVPYADASSTNVFPLYSNVFNAAGFSPAEVEAAENAFAQLSSFINVTFSRARDGSDPTFGFGKLNYQASAGDPADPSKTTGAWASPGAVAASGTADGDMRKRHASTCSSYVLVVEGAASTVNAG